MASTRVENIIPRNSENLYCSNIGKLVPFPQTYYTVNKTITTTTTLEFNCLQRRRSSIMSSQNVEGITALMLACLQGRPNEVETILKKNKTSFKNKTKSGKLPLHFCAEGGNVKCLELILGVAEDQINVQDEEGYTPIHLAVINGNKEVVKILIANNAELKVLDKEKHSLIHWATVCGELEILDILLGAGAPAATPDIHLAHPIHYAAQMCGGGSNGNNGAESRVRDQSSVYGVSPKRGMAILRRLIQHGVPVDVKDKDGRQPLLWASSTGSADGILELVNAGANVQAEDKDGLTALHCAASRGHTDCIETLIALCGAEVDVIDNNGCTALFYAITLGHADSTELLLSFGAEPNRQDRKGRTPAHCGASKGQLETLKIFAKHGGNLWMKNVRGDLPLHEAIISRRKDLVLWLLSQRPDTVNAPNNDGRCPIHLAALNNNVELVKILIDHHVEINSLMRTGKGTSITALDAAMHKGNSAVAKFIQLHGGLPVKSLSDSSLHRRINRNIDSQARSTSSLRGSRLSNNEFSSDQLHNFTSPEVQDNSRVHEYANRVVDSVLRETSYLKMQTPIDDGVQTDSSHYQRNMEVQTTGDLAVSGGDESKPRDQTLSSESNRSKISERRRKKKRKSTSKVQLKSDENLVDSTTDTETEQRKAEQRTLRKPRSRRGSKSPPESQHTETGSTKCEEEQSKEASSPEKTKVTNQKSVQDEEHVAKTKDPNETFVQENTFLSNECSSPRHDSEPYNNESDRFSELEKVAAQSSESESRPEEFEATENDVHYEIITEDCKIRDEKLSNELENEATQNEICKQSLENEQEIISGKSLDEGSHFDTEELNSQNSDEINQQSEKRKQEMALGKSHDESQFDTEEHNSQNSDEATQEKDENDTLHIVNYIENYKGDEEEIMILETLGDEEISLQEAYAKRRKSRSKSKSLTPKSETESKVKSDTEGKPVTKNKTSRTGIDPPKKIEKTKSKTSANKTLTTKKKITTDSEEREIRLQEQLLSSNKVSETHKSVRVEPIDPQNKLTSPHVHYLEEEIKVSQQIKSQSKNSNHSDGTTSIKRDSGYSDHLLPTTSASEDQRNIIYTPKLNGASRRKVISRRPGSTSSAITRRQGVRTIKERRRPETNIIKQRLMESENGSGDTTSFTGSATSEDERRIRDPKSRSSRARLTFTKGEDLARLSPFQKKSTDVDTPISVTQAMQASMRKYQLERKIFQELLELKRLQIRAGKANEQVLVKRLADAYRKAGLSVNFREYDGAYTFRNFEKYLYDQLRLLQANRKLIPRFAPSDDLEKLSTALKKMNATKLPFLDDIERHESGCDSKFCTHTTHRCHHAAHAYTGVPCAYYVTKGRQTPFLPKVDPLKAPGPIQKDVPSKSIINMKDVQMIVEPKEDRNSPITLEVQQGDKSQVFSLPNSLDPSKNYYVSLSIKPTPSPPIPPESHEKLTPSPRMTSPIYRNSLDDLGSISAPPVVTMNGESKEPKHAGN